MKWLRTLLCAALTTTAVLSAVTTPPAAAAEDPKAGDPCTADDLGKRYPFIKNATLEPTVTHFKSYFVTAGTTGQQVVTLATQTVITVAIGNTTQISSGFSIASFFKVDAMVNRTVTKTTATTSGETQAITWNFTQPGYYGLYQGTRKVTGEYGSINCDNVGDTLRWVERSGGTYTTFTAVEEGVVTCADVVPANSLMKKAQQKLECEGAAPAAEEPEPAPAVSTPKRGIVAPSAVPPGFTCRPGYYRIGTTDGMLFWWQVDASKNFQLRPWWEPGDRGSVLPMWSVCTGPQTNGMTEHVFINREDDRCLSVQPAEQGNDGGQLTEDTCRTIEDLQRFYLYRDVAGSNKVGIQNKQTGFMIGQARIADNEPMRHYSMGSPDAKGTYVLEPVPAW